MLGKIKKVFQKHYVFITMAVFSTLIIWPIFLPGYFSHHDDLQVMRIFEMRKCFEDLQIPCRWVPDMGYGNGYPLFNYYSVLPYYIGGVLSYFFSFIWSAKILFLIPLVVAPVAMYFLGKELFGRMPGLVAAVLYMFAPYRALDTYVRGAVAESFALAIIPLVFYFSLKVIREGKLINLIGLSVSFGLFLMSHNIMTMLFSPFILAWVIFWQITQKSKNLIKVLLGLILGFGLAAFFVLPFFLEKSLVQSETLISGGLDFRVHFVTLYQLFIDRTWGYGASVFGPNDTISFQIGWPHWWLMIVAAGLVVLRIKHKVLSNQNFYLSIFLILVFLLSIFMTHNKSTFIWLMIEPLQYTQFPWRFLSITVFVTSLIGGLMVVSFKKYQFIIAIIIICLAVLLNWSFFKPADFYTKLTDQEKLSGELWRIQQQAGILDYLPKDSAEPKGPSPDRPEVISGRAEVSKFNNKSNRWEFNIKVSDKANIEVPVFDFPIWEVVVNGKHFDHNHHNRLGRIRLDLAPGEYQISGYFQNTPIRTIANLITLTSSIALIGLVFLRKKRTVLNKFF